METRLLKPFLGEWVMSEVQFKRKPLLRRKYELHGKYLTIYEKAHLTEAIAKK